MTRLRNRRGLALLWTLATLILLSILATGAFHMALGDARRANDAQRATAVDQAANAAVYQLAALWPGTDLDSVPIGDTLPAATRTLGTVTTVTRALRSSTTTWWVTGTAFSPDSTSHESTLRRVALAARLVPPTLPTDAVLTARDSVEVIGSGEVAGRDTVAGALGAGCTAGAAAAGIATPDSTHLIKGNVTGAPPVWQHPSIGSSALYLSFGSESWADLTMRAQIVLPGGTTLTPAPSVSAGVCNRVTPGNWGDPLGGGPCARWAPLIWVRGDVTLNGGAAQGLLLVDGTVTIAGGAEFHGVIAARNDLRSGAGGGVVLGAVLVADSAAYTGNHSLIGPGLRLQRASCLVAAVLRRHAPLRPVRLRPWAVMP